MGSVQVRTRLRARFAVGALLAVAACGPDPSVETVATRPGSPYLVDAVVVNRGGAGQVSLSAAITDRRTRDVLDKEEKEVEMKRGERLHVRFALHLPSVGEEKAQSESDLGVGVEARYPIE
jgi:hypothetical protein